MALDLIFIEDNSHKRAKIFEFLSALDPRPNITEAHSYTSACQKLDSGEYDCALVDISLPTYDRTSTEAGGRFRAFAGRELARRIVRHGGIQSIIFITQYSSFSERGNSYSFDELRNLLVKECGVLFRELIYYDSSQSAWKEALTAQLSKINNENSDR